MVLENEEIDRLMARKKAIQDTLAAQARNPAPSRGGGCSSGGCSSSSAAAAPRYAAPQTGWRRAPARSKSAAADSWSPNSCCTGRSST